MNQGEYSYRGQQNLLYGPLLWPWRLQFWLVGNRAWRVPYGSPQEFVWFGVFCAAGAAAVISRVAARIIATKLDPAQGARLLGLQTDQLLPIGLKRVYAVPLFADLD